MSKPDVPKKHSDDNTDFFRPQNLGIWRAHNDIVPLEHGHRHVVFPLGTWTHDRHEAHQGENLYPAAFDDRFGGMGIHLFNVHGLTGMGVTYWAHVFCDAI